MMKESPTPLQQFKRRRSQRLYLRYNGEDIFYPVATRNLLASQPCCEVTMMKESVTLLQLESFFFIEYLRLVTMMKTSPTPLQDTGFRSSESSRNVTMVKTSPTLLQLSGSTELVFPGYNGEDISYPVATRRV
jgi:hypothetical protein